MTETNQDIPPSDDDPLFEDDEIIIRDTINDSDGNALDLSGASVEFYVYDGDFGATPILSLTDTDSQVSSDSNPIEITLSETELSTLAPDTGLKTYQYRIRVVTIEGTPDTVTTGKLSVNAGEQ